MNLRKAALINAAGKYSKIILSLVVTAVLARILSPKDYGVVAVVTVFSTFFTTLSDMGFGPAIIQIKQLTQKDISNIFSFTVYISIALAGLFLLFSKLIVLFYNNAVYLPLGQLLSISLLFNALNMVPNGILNRQKKFGVIAFRTVAVYLVSSIIAIIMAFAGFRYYALVAQAIITAFLTFIWNVWSTRPSFIPLFAWSSVKKVLNFSGYQFAFNLINYFSRNLDNLLAGKYLGNVDLGYYNKAYNLMLYPVNNLTGVISPVLHPLLSDFQKKPDIILQKYTKIVRTIGCVAIYVAAVSYLGAGELITLMYGQNWSRSIDCFQLLAIAILPQMINSTSGAIFQATNNTRLLFINSCINTLITVIAILIGIFIGHSIVILSLCIAIAYCIHFFTANYMLIKFCFKMKFKTFILKLLPEIFVLFIMVAGIIIYPFHIDSTFMSIIIKAVYLGVLYIIGLILTKDYKLFLSIVRR